MTQSVISSHKACEPVVHFHAHPNFALFEFSLIVYMTLINIIVRGRRANNTYFSSLTQWNILITNVDESQLPADQLPKDFSHLPAWTSFGTSCTFMSFRMQINSRKIVFPIRINCLLRNIIHAFVDVDEWSFLHDGVSRHRCRPVYIITTLQ